MARSSRATQTCIRKASEHPVDWDAWIAEGLARARRIERAGYRREADEVRAYIARRTSELEERQRCVVGRCRLPRLDAPWCHRHAPRFEEAM